MELDYAQGLSEKEFSSFPHSRVHSLGTSVGKGGSIAHHGEIFQGVIEDQDGRLHRGLVSLPCDIFHSEATFIPDASGIVRVTPHWKVKAHRAVELLLARNGQGQRGGLLSIESTVPVGLGLGSSTTDITAAIRAAANAFHEQVTPREMAELAVKAETASDSTMFNHRLVLFAHREGTILEEFSGNLPSLTVLGFNSDASKNGVDTLGLRPAEYSSWEIEAFRPLIGLLRRAIEIQNPNFVGYVATASAHINQSRLPLPHFDRLIQIREKVGALGLQVAHSGTVAGFLFDSHDPEKEHRLNNAKRLVDETGFRETWQFQIGMNNGAGERI